MSNQEQQERDNEEIVFTVLAVIYSTIAVGILAAILVVCIFLGF